MKIIKLPALQYCTISYSSLAIADKAIADKAMDGNISLTRTDGVHADIGSLGSHLLAQMTLGAGQAGQDSGSPTHTSTNMISMRRTDAAHDDVGAGSKKKDAAFRDAPTDSVRIVHISDTHNKLTASPSKSPDHRSQKGSEKGPSNGFLLPEASVMVHSGNFTVTGTEEEFGMFEEWLASITSLYPVRIVVLGSKDVKVFGMQWAKYKSMLPSATHVLCHEGVTVQGLRFFGCGWHPGIKSNGTIRPGQPMSTSLRYEEIPVTNVDILVTHGPSLGCLDKAPGVRENWGSKELSEAIDRLEPSVHLHGHIKEARGFVKAFGKRPFVLNSCCTDSDKADCVLYAAPHVLVATRVTGEGGGGGGGGGRFSFNLAPLLV